MPLLSLTSGRALTAAFAVLGLLEAPAPAQEAGPAPADAPASQKIEPPPAPAEPPVPPEEEEADAEEPPEVDLEAMNQEIESLKVQLEQMEEARKARLPIKLTGYGDVGFFVPEGDGSGVRRDIGNRVFPEMSDYSWVFYGDLLAEQVNSRGDVADLGDLPGVDRFDSVNSNGNPTFLVNELNLTVNAGLSDRALFTGSVNFTPRSGNDFALGDSFDVDVVQLEWVATDDQNHSIFVGKVDSVLGIEYKTRKANQRFGITPSLIARYTTGTAVGLKARSKLLGERLILAAAVTNGSFGTEQFHFAEEVDSNAGKTATGRVAFRLPFASAEIGVSGQYGQQDRGYPGSGDQWFLGADAELEYKNVHARAEYLRGRAPGDEVSRAYELDLKRGGYLEVNYLVTPWLGVLGRGELRHADVELGEERLYITRSWRAVAGTRVVFNANMVLKAEYLYNGEYGRVPKVPNNVFTTSMVLAF